MKRFALLLALLAWPTTADAHHLHHRHHHPHYGVVAPLIYSWGIYIPPAPTYPPSRYHLSVPRKPTDAEIRDWATRRGYSKDRPTETPWHRPEEESTDER
jgi:hypothetical protein